ncbi:potassium channel LctB [Bacillus ectoiniformans]|uniref:potassium channel family protein n=1 Tax=Bacillus ectoiniformans TaxID=1494429 RepID=UPI001959F556|nr:potassium channel family protein [Bacillus ectoiniformans]MBM7650270.1 potassium channel LctB [Bacillus ectoiniformans]
MTVMMTGAVVICMIMSMKGLFSPARPHHRYLSFTYFIYFGFLYLTIMIGFALIYLLMDMMNIIIITGENSPAITYWDKFFTSLYFSGITLFSVGYGDIVPEGAGRWVAMLEAWVGYTIPTAFVVRTMLEKDSR